MSISISDYLNTVSAIAATAQNASVADSTVQTGTASSDKDSYIASGVDEDTVFPSDNYNNILDVVLSAKAEHASLSSGSGADSGTGTASAAGDDATGAVGSAGGSGGGGGSDSEDEEETSTKIVTIGGVAYLETTTVSNGVTTVTRTALSAS
jgi:uncharacterized membrane protein YgcG